MTKKINRKLLITVKEDPRPAYQIAKSAKVAPTLISAAINRGYIPTAKQQKRLAVVLGKRTEELFA